MMSKDAVQKRLETGISYTEFSYQLLQAYDFQVLYREYGCVLQMGGSDQWGNIVSGSEFIRRNLGEKAYAITAPLLTKADGSKFGKSTEGNIWLDPELTSPYQFYQFWINAADADIARYTRYFTLHTREEIEERERELAENPQERKRLLGEELTRRVHSDEAYHSVLRVSELLFGRQASREQLLQLDPGELAMVAREIPSVTVKRELLAGGVNIVDLLTEQTNIIDSKGNARRAIQNNAIAVNKDKVSSHEHTVDQQALLHGRYLMVENGKKNKHMLIAE